MYKLLAFELDAGANYKGTDTKGNTKIGGYFS